VHPFGNGIASVAVRDGGGVRGAYLSMPAGWHFPESTGEALAMAVQMRPALERNPMHTILVHTLFRYWSCLFPARLVFSWLFPAFPSFSQLAGFDDFGKRQRGRGRTGRTAKEWIG
jgi:hypothetical protein